jgi:hypothetical protein
MIERWNYGASFEHSFDCDAHMYASVEGEYVTYADHMEALRQAKGQRDAIAAAVQRVEALPWTSETWIAHAERAAIIDALRKDSTC